MTDLIVAPNVQAVNYYNYDSDPIAFPFLDPFDDPTRLRRDVRAIGERQQQQALSILDRLFNIVHDHGSKEAEYAIDRIVACCLDRDNTWLDEHYPDKSGDTFAAIGTDLQCGERLCPNCAVRHNRKNKKAARDGARFMRQNEDELKHRFVAEHYKKGSKNSLSFGWRFAVFTMPVLPGVSLVDGLKISITAFGLLQGRSCWKKFAIGGCRNTEFLLGNRELRNAEGRAWDFDLDGFNIHHNLLVYSAKLDLNRLELAWAESVEKACRRHGIDAGVVRLGWGIRVSASTIRSNYKTGKPISFNDTLAKVINYVGKPKPWLELPEDQILDVLNTRQMPHMSATFGAMRKSKLTADLVKQSRKSVVLSRSERPQRLYSNNLTTDEKRESFNRRKDSLKAFRREQRLLNNPYTEFQTLDGEIYSAADSTPTCVPTVAATKRAN